MKRNALVIVVGLVLLAYVGSYVALRGSHRIMHFSNAAHPVAALRTPGHTVGVARESDWLIEWTFKPLMLVERAYHHAAG